MFLHSFGEVVVKLIVEFLVLLFSFDLEICIYVHLLELLDCIQFLLLLLQFFHLLLKFKVMLYVNNSLVLLLSFSHFFGLKIILNLLKLSSLLLLNSKNLLFLLVLMHVNSSDIALMDILVVHLLMLLLNLSVSLEQLLFFFPHNVFFSLHSFILILLVNFLHPLSVKGS